MIAFEHQIPEYLHQTLGVQAHLAAWDGADRLPAFLRALYRFARMDLHGRELLLMVDEAPDPEPPATVRTHAEQVRARWGGPIVYVRDRVAAYHRKRLIEQRVPFIVPGNQMYLPELGIDLREHFRTPAPARRRLRPAAQAVLIVRLLDRSEDGVTASELAPVLGYTTMTLSRAFDELEAAELAASEVSGRERRLRFPAGRRETWERVHPWLIDPVQSRHFVAAPLPGLRAGQDALASCTMIAEPRLPVTAISHKRWLALTKEASGPDLVDRDAAGGEVEVWKYEPREHDRPGIVDPLSLLLSLRQTADERVEQALDALMEQVRW